MEKQSKDEVVQGKAKIVKMSYCPKCERVIRVAVADYLAENTKARNEFSKEVMKHNLAVKEMTLDEYKESKFEMFCKCD